MKFYIIDLKLDFLAGVFHTPEDAAKFLDGKDLYEYVIIKYDRQVPHQVNVWDFFPRKNEWTHDEILCALYEA